MPREDFTELVVALERIFERLPDPVRLIAPDGEVLFSNEASRTYLPGGLGHRSHGESEETFDSSCPNCQMAQVFERGSPMRWHVAVPRPNREDARDFYEATLTPVPSPDGSVGAVLEILKDVTATLGLEHFLIGEAERHEAEVQQRREEVGELEVKADALREELRALRESQAEILYRDRLISLGRMVANVAHEIHTPLGAVLSSADILRRSAERLAASADEPDSPISDECAARLEAIGPAADVVLEGSRRIEAVIRALRTFTRLDEAPLKEVDLHEGLDSTIELLRYRMGDRIRIVRDYGTLPLVNCRSDALNQVFMNLLHNSVQSILEEGEVRIRTWAEDGHVVVEVHDTGEGIAEENLSRIFELGFTTKERGVGSGIGLAICQRIVQDHGGSMSVESEVGEGTTFTLRLPLEPPVGRAS
jgi:signal transduction histidine kinase